MTGPCVFCDIIAGRAEASIVCQDEFTLAFIDLRQFHPGHVLVIPRAHLADVRELDPATGAALMDRVVRISRAVSASFPNDGLSLWHSVGPGAHQEVPHLHIHVHPRRSADGFMRMYPSGLPASASKLVRDEYAERLRRALDVG